MVLMDLIGLVVLVGVVGFIGLMLSPIVLFFVHINRVMWRWLNPAQRSAVVQRDGPTENFHENGDFTDFTHRFGR